jgi:plasmid stability protein
MAQLIVRNLDDAVKRKLQRRAARHGRSMEEEARDILRNALRGEGRWERGLGSAIAARFKGLGIKDGDIRELHGYPVKPIKFDE